MVDISATQVKELRAATGAGVLDCKKALEETGGDLEKAIEALRTKGLAEAQKKAGRSTHEGLIDSYIHLNGKIGVLIEVNCETDFVARTEQFSELTHDLCMQIAAADPSYIDREQVPADILEQERHILMEQAKGEGKPEEIAQKIVEGRMEKFFSQICLMDQAFIKDPDRTVEEVVNEYVATLGENIRVSRFTRFALGEDSEG
ncbi:MAG: translation elongation factor Ts [Clostridia bacterium]